MPKKKHQYTAFYRTTKAFNYNFTGDAVSSDGGIVLLSKLERKHQLGAVHFVPPKRPSLAG